MTVDLNVAVTLRYVATGETAACSLILGCNGEINHK